MEERDLGDSRSVEREQPLGEAGLDAVNAISNGEGAVSIGAPSSSSNDLSAASTQYVSPVADFVGRSTDPGLCYRIVKRAFDIVFSAVVCILLILPGAILSVFIWRETGASPIYVSHRMGLHGRPIGVFKFRSMYADADNVEKYLSPEQLRQWRTEMKVDTDPRVTPIGHVIRKTSIDEFPQFLNVFLGSLSVVGPRPISRSELHWYGDDEMKLLSVKPGITGLWQVTQHNNATYESGVRQKIELAYVDCRSIALDARIVFGTFGAMLQK